MGFLEVIVIAIGVSMDAFAVSITLGLSDRNLKTRELLIPGMYFGFFQALMPFLGYFMGIYFVDKIESVDHWIAFALLGFIGGKMMKGSFSRNDEKIDEKTNANALAFARMLFLAVATSIDALAVGITFAFFGVDILKAALATGLTTFFISTGGVKIGNMFGAKYKSISEFVGGAILLLLGTKILIEHLVFK